MTDGGQQQSHLIEASDHTTEVGLLGLAIVVIGRNEGERLRSCLRSIQGRSECIVYVDSGSDDGSVELARALGAEVCKLDMSRPFTAARARNVGFRRALELRPGLRYVHFVDGDCVVAEGWLAAALAFLTTHECVSTVFGQQRERAPEASIYNRLCDIEWRVAPGPVKACGGNAMFRTAAFTETGGYREDLIAGEEPELCVRLRALGWTIECLAVEMSLHDAAMTRFSQWWLRTMRGGYAYAQGVQLHGRRPERHCVRQLGSAFMWAIGVPTAVGLTWPFAGSWAAAGLCLYPLQILRIAKAAPGTLPVRLARGAFLVLGKFPETQGAMRFWRNTWQRRAGTLIEYK